MLQKTTISSLIPLVFVLFCLFPSHQLFADTCEESSVDESALGIAYNLISANESSQAIRFCDSILQVLNSENLEHCPTALWISLEKGQGLEMETEFQQALQLYYQIIEKAQSQEFWEIVANAFISISRSHEILGRANDCRRNLEIAKEYIEEYNLNKVRGRYSIRASSFQRIYASLDTARTLARDGLVFGRKYGPERYLVDAHLLMGIITPEIDSSVFYFQNAIELFVERKDYEAAASMSTNIVSRYIRLKAYNSALSELKNSESYISLLSKESKGYSSFMSRYCESKSLLFEKSGNIDSSLYYLQKSIDFERQSNWIVDQEEVSKNAVAFAIEKEKLKTAEFERIAKFQQTGNILLTSLVFLSFVFGIVLLNSRRKIAQQNAVILQRNKDLNQSLSKQSLLLSEVHHRVKNNLQLVISLLTLPSQGASGNQEYQLLNEVSNKVRSISLIHEQLYREEEFGRIEIMTYISSLCNHFYRLHESKSELEFKVDTEKFHFNIDTVLPLGIICSELISNSLKYASQKQLVIAIKVEKIDQKYVLSYADNGVGYDLDKLNLKRKSMGMNLIESMVRQLKAEHRFYNDPGASFTIMFVEKRISDYIK